MIKTDRAVIVEGKYDKIRLSSLIDALIIETGGFSLFNNSEKKQLIKRLAETRGIVIVTDSDAAGFKIRNYIKNFASNGDIVNVYIPDIPGKEKRKDKPSKEGKLGVEGINSDILAEAFARAGITDAYKSGGSDNARRLVTKLDLYEDGLSGGENSAEKRRRLLESLSLPKRLSASQMPEVLNSFFTYEEYKDAVRRAEKYSNDNEKNCCNSRKDGNGNGT